MVSYRNADTVLRVRCRLLYIASINTVPNFVVSNRCWKHHSEPWWSRDDYYPIRYTMWCSQSTLSTLFIRLAGQKVISAWWKDIIGATHLYFIFTALITNTILCPPMYSFFTINEDTSECEVVSIKTIVPSITCNIFRRSPLQSMRRYVRTPSPPFTSSFHHDAPTRT